MAAKRTSAPKSTARTRNGFVQFFVSLGEHLTRSTARIAWAMAALCFVLYRFVDWEAIPGLNHGAAQNVLLTLFSISLGAVFLPEFSSHMWTFTAERIRNLIPGDKRDALSQELIKSESDDARWNGLVWDHALEPLLAASRTPSNYILDMDYHASVYVDNEITVGGRTIPVTRVSVEQKSLRILNHVPAQERRWISVVRNTTALQVEHGFAGCMSREIANIDGLSEADWAEHIVANCNASVMVSGVTYPLEPVVAEGISGVVRFMFPATFVPSHDRERVVITYDFLTSASDNEFLVSFSSYYVAGVIDITLDFYGDPDRYVLGCDPFVGTALNVSGPVAVPIERKQNFTQARFTSGADTLLWPGSGVKFAWTKRG